MTARRINRPLYLFGLVLGTALLSSVHAAGAVPAAGLPDQGASLRIELGLKDKQATDWSGRIGLSQGELVELTVIRPATGAVEGAAWKARSNVPKNRPGRAVRPALQVVVAAPQAARVTVQTAQGNVDFTLGELPLGQAKTFMQGQVRVTRFPLTVAVTSGAEEEDLPAATIDKKGRIWVAYLAYKQAGPLDAAKIHQTKDFSSLEAKGNGDQIRLMHFDGTRWHEPLDVTPPGGDVWRPTVAVDGTGQVWVVWSENFDENWELVARSFDPNTGKLSRRLRLTNSPGADVDPVAVTNPITGQVSVVWQGWRTGSFDILMLTLSDGKPQPERVLFATDANEWWPAAVFDAAGNLYVAFDTYEAGNYDVKLLCGATEPNPKLLDVAATDLFEARPALAVDNRDRLWIAYEEAGANWGKDTGMRWMGRRGELLYWRRNIQVRVLEAGRLRQTAGKVPAELIARNYPDAKTERISLPRLAVDNSGNVWLAFRRHPLLAGSGEVWTSFVTRYEGNQWTTPVQLTHSENLMDNRPVLLAQNGRMLVIHSSDRRVRNTQSAKQNDLFCSVLPVPRSAAAAQLVDLPPTPEVPEPVHPNEAAEVQRIRSYRIVVGGKTYRLMRGEFHRHTELTSHRDQDGTLQDMWRYGMDAAAMDWIGNGDHDNGYGVEYLWWLVQKQTSIYHHPPYFVPMYTYERSVSYPSGHRNAMFARRGIRPLPRIPGGKQLLYGTPEEGSPDIETFYAYLKHFHGICASHTSGTNMGTDWRDNDPAVEPVVEIYQGLRHSYEHYGAPATAKGPQDAIGGFQPAGFVWNALKKGYRLGFESSSDHYSTHISYSMVWVEEPTREGIIDGFRRRHCYAAHDNIILDVRCGDHLMGDMFSMDEKPTLEITALGTAPIVRLSIIRGVGSDEPRYVYDSEPNRQQVHVRWTDRDPQPGYTSYYYVRIEQVRPEGGYGALAWSSPMWIKVER